MCSSAKWYAYWKVNEGCARASPHYNHVVIFCYSILIFTRVLLASPTRSEAQPRESLRLALVGTLTVVVHAVQLY